MSNLNKKTNSLAIVAIIIVWFVPIAGLIYGIIANNQIKESGEDGRTMALIATIAGAVLLGLTAVFIIVMAVFGAAGADGVSYSYDIASNGVAGLIGLPFS